MQLLFGTIGQLFIPTSGHTRFFWHPFCRCSSGTRSAVSASSLGTSASPLPYASRLNGSTCSGWRRATNSAVWTSHPTLTNRLIRVLLNKSRKKIWAFRPYTLEKNCSICVHFALFSIIIFHILWNCKTESNRPKLLENCQVLKLLFSEFLHPASTPSSLTFVRALPHLDPTYDDSEEMSKMRRRSNKHISLDTIKFIINKNKIEAQRRYWNLFFALSNLEPMSLTNIRVS